MEEINKNPEFDNTDKKLHIFGVSDSDFIFKLLEQMLNKQEEDVVNYMNECMTQTERNKHGENIWSCLLRAKGTLDKICMEMLADGRKIK